MIYKFSGCRVLVSYELIVAELSHDCHKNVTKVCYPMLHNLTTTKGEILL